MQNRRLAFDHVTRAERRLLAIDALYRAEAWADVVRESQECVELALKGLLRSRDLDVPRIHDVSEILLAERDRFPSSLSPDVERLAEISRRLRRDRELAFYGSSDLTPLEFYKVGDAHEARESARWVVATVRPFVAPA